MYIDIDIYISIYRYRYRYICLCVLSRLNALFYITGTADFKFTFPIETMTPGKSSKSFLQCSYEVGMYDIFQRKGLSL